MWFKKKPISRDDILGGVAKWGIRQSPYHRPDNIEIVLDKKTKVIEVLEGMKDERSFTEEQMSKYLDAWQHGWNYALSQAIERIKGL